MIDHHDLDAVPVGEKVLFANEPWLMDKTAEYGTAEPENEDDNVRIYVPIDLNKASILRRLRAVIAHYGEANEGNESSFSEDVYKLVSQIEIYNQVWRIRHIAEMKRAGQGQGRVCWQTGEAQELVREFIWMLEKIPDGCAECFPFELIDELKADYLE